MSNKDIGAERNKQPDNINNIHDKSNTRMDSFIGGAQGNSQSVYANNTDKMGDQRLHQNYSAGGDFQSNTQSRGLVQKNFG